MKLTPLDIRQKEFKRGMRGYVDAEVDEFLDEVADEFERVFRENIDLSEKVAALEEQLRHYRTIEETLHKTLLTAQQSAEEVKANAQKQSHLMLQEAEMKARSMLTEAYSDKQEVEKQIVVLRNAEADFRFRFRRMLEDFLAQLVDGDEARERAAELAKQAQEVRDAIVAQGLAGAAAEDSETAAPEQPAEAEVIIAVVEEPDGEVDVVVAEIAEAPAEAAPDVSPPDEAVAETEDATMVLPAAPQAAAAEIEEATAEVPLAAARPTEEDTAETPTRRRGRLLFGEDDDLFSDVDADIGEAEFKW